MRTLIVGHGGRESALAWRMAEHSQLCAYMGHANPSIIEHVIESHGAFMIGNVLDAAKIADFAVQQSVELALVSSDEPLAAGVVDALLAKGIKAVGPTRDGAEIEWNKTFGRQIVAEVAPEANPFYRVARSHQEVDAIFKEIGDRPLAIKPVGLTGGKGVKVMGPHLADHAAAKAYCYEILDAGIGGGSAVIIEEKITGVEFGVQAFTDGKSVVLLPATFDYPYRNEGDTGPGTGGMGSYCVRTKNLPFMQPEHYEACGKIAHKVVARLSAMGRHFNGILYSSFFITDKGEIKVIEFNARFGDPECMNIMSILDCNFVELLAAMADKNLDPSKVKFKDACSVVAYLVAPEYGFGKSAQSYRFKLDSKGVREKDCEVFFSASQQVETSANEYETVGTSRCVAIGALGKSLDEARKKIISAMGHVQGPLQWRQDIATEKDIDKQKAVLTSSPAGAKTAKAG